MDVFILIEVYKHLLTFLQWIKAVKRAALQLRKKKSPNNISYGLYGACYFSQIFT